VAGVAVGLVLVGWRGAAVLADAGGAAGRTGAAGAAGAEGAVTLEPVVGAEAGGRVNGLAGREGAAGRGVPGGVDGGVAVGL
jgi:hypothetical protein